MQKEFNIDNKIYSEGIIISAIEVFGKIANVKLSNKSLIIEGNNSLEIDEIFNEFMNYTIGLINE